MTSFFPFARNLVQVSGVYQYDSQTNKIKSYCLKLVMQLLILINRNPQKDILLSHSAVQRLFTNTKDLITFFSANNQQYYAFVQKKADIIINTNENDALITRMLNVCNVALRIPEIFEHIVGERENMILNVLFPCIGATHEEVDNFHFYAD